jgi:hypothetical protein
MLFQEERLLKCENKPALELSKRPARGLCAGRITVDAREKVNGSMMPDRSADCKTGDNNAV